jgi:hypothetical protein
MQMLRSLAIRRFRAFDAFAVNGLSRVNLLLGANNAGKTTVMEAAELLLAGGAPWALARSPVRRSDGQVLGGGSGPARSAVSLKYLFYGHELRAGTSFELTAEGRAARHVRCELRPASEGEVDSEQMRLPATGLLAEDDTEDLEPELMLAVSGPDKDYRVRLRPGGLLLDRFPRDREDDGSPVNFVDTRDPEHRLAMLWDRVVLTPRELEVVKAIRLVDPSIERIAQLSNQAGYRPQMVVKRTAEDEPVPLGTMGDGAKRLVVLAVNLVNAAKGYLLVDEIDTGLHHTVLRPMWRLVLATARALDVQVFASTHSLDCVRALSWALEQESDYLEDVTVHRIVRGNAESVRYGGNELKLAMEQDMELR